MIGTNPYTVHEAEAGFFHAWGDGIPVGGPLPRHLAPALSNEFRVGCKISQTAGGGLEADFGEWRLHRPQTAGDAEWMVEMELPLGAMTDEAAVQLSSFTRTGTPVVLVLRFRCRETGYWRLLQFHDAVLLPSDVTEDGQRMLRTVKVSAGWMEESKSGTMPAVQPRLRGVVEWRHLGRVVRCWEYDAAANTWAEDAENVTTLDGETFRYVSLDFSGADAAVSGMAARTEDGVAGGVAATGMAWIDARMFRVESSSLTGEATVEMEPGWELETLGCAEPLLLPESGRHWEHPRVVFRFLGRTYATAQGGVLAMPALTSATPEKRMDFPIRLGRLLLYPEGGQLI